MRYYSVYLRFKIVLLISQLMVLAGVSLSFAFTAETYGNFDDVAVISVEGDYDAPSSDCGECKIPRQVISKEFYKTHQDQYDFIIVFSNFDFQMPVSYVDGVRFVAEGFLSQVSNSVHGIGMEIYDYSSWYGSSGRLKGVVDMGWVGKKVTSPLDPQFSNTMKTMSHELLHQWAAHVRFKNDLGDISNALIGLDDAHWSYLLDTQGSVMYGNKWRDNGNGTFTSLPGVKYYSPLDLYLMGLIGKAEVPPMFLIENPAINSDKLSKSGDTIEGIAKTVSIDDIITIEGERIPSAADSPKSFKYATILIIRPGTFNEGELYQVRSVINEWGMWFSALTDGRGRIFSDVTPVDDIPENPGIDPLPYEPRELPAEVQDAVNWLISKQEENGSWKDSDFTRRRDTIHSLAAVGRFPEGIQSADKGMVWLTNEHCINTDALAGKIIALAEKGQNCDSVKTDLLAGQNPDGGWGANRNYISNPLDTSFALAALSEVKISDATIITPAIEYLKSHQHADGGWGSNGDTSDIQTTVNVLSGFAHYQETFNLSDNIQNALNWLYGRQNSDGGFGNSPSTVYDTALALMLLARMNAPAETVQNALNYILGCQSRNGSWYESPYQTALAVNSIWKSMEEPDLIIETSDITIQPSSITALPAEISITAVVRNKGFTNIAETSVALYRGSISAANQIGGQTVSIPGNSSATVNFTDTVREGQPQYYYVVADAFNQVSESCETNNKAMKILNADVTYDFEILDSDITVSPVVSDMLQPVSITASIKNKGAANAYYVPVKFLIDGIEISSTTVDLLSGTAISKQITWIADKSGNVNVSVSVDPADMFPGEITETNNTGVTSITINPSSQPNLKISYENLTVSPLPVPQGGTAKLSILVENNGFAPVENVEVKFYAGEPQQGNLIGTSVIPALNPGESKLAAFDWTDIQISGDTVIYITVSGPEGVEEISGSDNSAFTTVEIVSLPDLFVSPATVVADPAIAREDDSVRIVVTVINKGKQAATNVGVALGESCNTFDTGNISAIAGNSQQTVTFLYNTSGKIGPHTIEVKIDPENTVTEISETNNTASCGFAVRDGEQWLTQSCISPNGDSIQDATSFFFKLDAPKTVKINIVNDRGEVVRTMSGGSFDNCMGGEVAWDGLDDSGKVVPDGRYQINVVDEHGVIVAGVYVVVDNNRSTFAGAIGTPYFSTKNIACHVQDIQDFNWFSDESGLLFDIRTNYYNPSTTYPVGLYTMSPDGDDINRLTPWEWQWEQTGTSFKYQYVTYDLSEDNESIVFVLGKYAKTNNRWNQVESQIWTVDSYGRNLSHVITSSDSIGYVSYAPDRSKIAYVRNSNSLYFINPDGSGNVQIAQNTYVSTVNPMWSWCEDSSRLAYVYEYDYQCGPLYKLCIADIRANISQYDEFNNVVDFRWLNPNQLIVVNDPATHTDWSEPWFYDIWLVDVTGNTGARKIATGIYDQYYCPATIDFTTGIYVNPINNGTFAFIDNSGESWAVKLCDSQGNCKVVYESLKVNYDFWGHSNASYCYDCYVSINDLRWSPNGTKLAFLDFAYQPLIGEVLPEGAHDPCNYEVGMVVIDFISGEKKIYPIGDEESACMSCASFHFFTMEDSAWSKKGVLHYQNYEDDFSYDEIDISYQEDDSQGTYKIRIEQRGGYRAEIDYVALDINEYRNISPTSAVNINTGENILSNILLPDNIPADAYGQTLELTWTNLPATAQGTCRLSMKAREIFYSYYDGSLQWLDDRVLISQDLLKTIMIIDSDNGKADFLPIHGNGLMVRSPRGNYVTYNVYPNESGCEGNIWSLSTLLNSPAVLQVRRMTSAFVLEGTAMDLNFDHYVLEYANAEFPDTWNLIAPPSDTPVINGQFITWVPPNKGTYYVRLTVYDKAGNQTSARKQISWGSSTVISSLYKTDVTFSDSGPQFFGSGNIISPYTDSVKDAVALHYRVLEPVNLRFSICDAAGDLLKTVDKPYASVPAGGMEDYIVWDGKDDSGNIAPDGSYTIKILDYEFYVEMDRTPPEINLELSSIKALRSSSDDISRGLGRGGDFVVCLEAKADDANPKNWIIEYGPGENPVQWMQYSSGSGAVTDKEQFTGDEIGFVTGKTFRLTVEDAAGNISTKTSNQLEEQLILNQFEIPLDVWMELGNSLSSDGAPHWFTIELKRDEDDVFFPAESVPSSYLTPGPHIIKGLDTARLPIVNAVVQYCGADMGWIDAYPIDSIVPGAFEFELDITGIDMKSIYAIRVKALDQAGKVYFSNPMPVKGNIDFDIDTDSQCNLIYNQIIYESLKKIQFQSALTNSNSSGGYPWKDYKVLDIASGDVIKNGLNRILPAPGVENNQKYMLRILGTGKSNTTYESNIVAYPPGCGSFLIKVNYAGQGCGTFYSTVSITPDYGPLGPPSDFVQLTYDLLNFRDETLQTIDPSADVLNPTIFDVSAIAPGAYQVKAVLETRTATNSNVTSLIIDDIPPQAKITYPANSGKICPVQMIDESGKPKYIINVEGRAQDNLNVKSYTLYYGVGENPALWNKSIERDGEARSTLGQWNVTDLANGLYALKLEVLDAYGNTSCDVTPGFYVVRNVDWAVQGVDKTLFSPNGDGAFDDVRLSYALNESATVGADIVQGQTLVQSLLPEQPRPVGPSIVVWDNFSYPDGLYNIEIRAKDACGNVDEKTISGIEVDNTAPEAGITFPSESDPLGVIVEINGTARDKNFMQYRLEAVSIENPDHVIPIRESDYPVADGVLGVWNNTGLSGSWRLHLVARDKVGNTRDTSITVNLGNRQNLIRDLSVTHDLVSPNQDGVLDGTEIHFELNPEIPEPYNIVIEIRSLTNILEKTYQLSSISGGPHLQTWGGESDISGEGAVPDGVYCIILKAFLVSAPAAIHSESITVAVDAAAPDLTIIDPAEAEYIRQELEIIGTVSDLHLKSYHIDCIGVNGTAFSSDGDQNRENYRFAYLTELIDGAYEVNFKAEDMAGNQTSKQAHFIVDKTPPEIHLISPANNSFYGNAKSPLIINGTIKEDSLKSWNLSYGSGVNPSQFTELANGAIQPEGGINFEWPVSATDGVADGTYTISLKAVDQAGWANECRAVVVIDNTAPLVEVTSPADRAYIKAFEIKGTVSDQNLKSYVIELSEGNCSTAAKWSTIATGKTNLEDGALASLHQSIEDNTYCVRVTAVDQLDALTTLTRSFTLDTKPPYPPVLSGVLKTTGERPLTWTQNTEPDIAGYNLYKNGALINSVLITGTSYIDTSLMEVTTIYTVRAVDLAGWESALSNRVEFKVDLTPPAARISVPQDGSMVGDLSDIKGTAYSSDDFKEYRVFWGEGQAPAQWTLIRKSPAPVSYGVLANTSAMLTDGAYYSIKLEAEDLSGNINTHVVVFQVDNLAPAAPILISAVPSTSNVNITWQANTEPDLAGYLIYRNNQLVNASGEVPDSLKSYLLSGTTYTDKNLPDGAFAYQLFAMDTTGNLSPSSNIITVQIDKHAPHMTIKTPVDGFQFDGSVVIEAQSADIDIAQVRFQYKRVASSSWSDLGDLLTNTTWKTNFDPKSLSQPYGEYNIRAIATDLSGNFDSAPTAIRVVYKDLQFPAPTGGLETVVNEGDVHLTWNPNSEEDLSGYNVYQLTGGTPVKINDSIVSDPEFTVSGLEDDNYIYAVSAVDASGNESTLSEAASAHVYTPHLELPSGFVSDPNLTFTGTAIPEVSIAIFNNGTVVSTVSSDVDGMFYGEIILAPGENEIKVQATDHKGNKSKTSVPVTLIFDEPPPVPTGLAATVTGTNCLLTWEAVTVEDIAGYHLYCNGEILGEVYNEYEDGLVVVTSYTHADLSDGLYEYQVSAVDIYGLESPLSPSVQVRIGEAQPPLPPQGLTATVTDMEIYLTWTANSEDDLAGYLVYKNTPNRWQALNSDILTDLEWTDSVLAYGQNQYRVTAIDQAGNESQPSDIVTAIVNSGSQPHPAITDVTASPEGDAVYICWEFSDWPASGFNLYRSLALEGPYVKINQELTDIFCYVDKDVTPGQLYYYKVVVVDEYGVEGGCSDPSQISAEDRTGLSKPVILEPTVSGKPLVAVESAIDISGAATPGTQVQLYQNGEYKGATLAGENHPAKEFVFKPDDNLWIDQIAVSPDGLYAAYLQEEMNSSSLGYELKIRDLENNSTKMVTDAVSSFIWSPKAGQLAYTVYQSVDGTLIEQIFIYDLLSDAHHALDEQTRTNQRSPAWSKDGNLIVFVSEGDSGIPDIWMKNIQTGTFAQLTQTAGTSLFPDAPSLSSDNHFVAFIDSQTNDLNVLDLESGEISCAATGINYSDITQTWYEWSPTSNQLIFLKYTDWINTIVVYDASTQRSRQITDSSDLINAFKWSDDGMYIIYPAIDYDDSHTEIKKAPANVPDCGKTLFDLDVEPAYLFTQASGAIWYGRWQEEDYILYQWFAGRFIFNGVDLEGGENEFYALGIDTDTGKISPRSDAIMVYVDQGTLPDLEISADSIYFYPAAPVSGETVAGSVTIQNKGAVAAQDSQISIYIIDQEENRELISSGTIAQISPLSAQNYEFSWDPAGKTGLYQISATVDPAGQILEISETNNTAQKEILISGTAGLSMTTYLDSEAYPPNSDIRIDIQVGNSGIQQAGRFCVEIKDSLGSPVAVIANQDLVMPYSYHQGFAFTWNTRDTYAGQYALKATLTNEDGSVRIENSAPFTIASDLAVTTQVTTDKRRYGPSESVLITALIKNNGENSYLNSVPASFKILDANANPVFVKDRELGVMFPQSSESWPVAWNTGLNAPGLYMAQVDVNLHGETVSSASRQFEIYSMADVSAELTLPSGAIMPGDAVNAAYRISNKGNAVIDGLALKFVLVDPDDSNITVLVETSTDQIGINGAISGTESLSTDGLSLKQYTLLLQAHLNGNWITAASRPLVITDAEAPVVLIVSPENDGIYHSKFNLIVEAEDAHSGVNLVEYQMDESQWVTLPLIDPSQSRYSISFNPSGQSVGDHTFRFRAVDTEGNMSTPVFAAIHIAPKIEVTATTNEANYGMNTDMPVAITIKNTGWAKNLAVNTVIENRMTNETVETLDPVPANVPYGATYPLIRTWNTGIHPPGDYQARISVHYGNQVLAEATVLFTILPVLNLDLSMETDKPIFDMQENLHAMIRATNNGNCMIPLAAIHVAIQDQAGGCTPYAADFQISDLSLGQTSSLTIDWNTVATPAGNYLIIARASVAGIEINQGNCGFTINPAIAFSGTLTVTPDHVAYGAPVQADGAIINNGNIPATGLTAKLVAIDPDNNAELRTYQSTIDVAIGQTHPVTFAIDTNGLPAKQYRVELQYVYGGEAGLLAQALFEIQDSVPPVAAIIAPADNSVHDKAFNVTVTATDDVSGIEKVEYRLGEGPWQLLLPAIEPNTFTGSYTPTEADSGERVISCRAFDKAGNESAAVSVHIRIELSSAFNSLVGSIAAAPHSVMQSMNETFSYSISNPMAEEINNLRIRIVIVRIDNGAVIKTLEHQATVAAQSVFAANFIDPVDLEPGTYNAALSVALDSPALERHLADDTFEVTVKPDMVIEKSVSEDIRLLVWLNDNCRLSPGGIKPSCGGSDYDWKDCIRTDLLENVLKQNVSDYRMVYDPWEFSKELRNPYYTDVLILGNQNQLFDHVSFELVEKINSGAGVISANWIPQQYAVKYNSIFGVKSIGKIPGNPSVKTVESPITSNGVIGSVGPSIRVEQITDTAVIAGRFVIDKKNKQATPAIVLNNFGKGKSVYFAFDLGMMLSDENFAWITEMMADVFSYIKGGPVQLPAYPWQVVPLSVSIDSSSVDYGARMIETFPEGLLLYDRQSREWIDISPRQKDITFEPDGKMTFWQYYLTPNLAGVYPTETETGIVFDGEYVKLQTTQVDIPVSAGRAGLIRNAIDRISQLPVDSRDNGHKMNAKRALEWVKASQFPPEFDNCLHGSSYGCDEWDHFPQLGCYSAIQHLYYSGVMYANILNIIYAIHEMMQIRSVDVAEIRNLLDTLLKIEEARYYFYDFF